METNTQVQATEQRAPAVGETVLMRHSSDGNGRSQITKSRSVDKIMAVYSHRDERSNNHVIRVVGGDSFAVQRCPKADAVWQTTF